jgi:hypothetical protein
VQPPRGGASPTRSLAFRARRCRALVLPLGHGGRSEQGGLARAEDSLSSSPVRLPVAGSHTRLPGAGRGPGLRGCVSCSGPSGHQVFNRGQGRGRGGGSPTPSAGSDPARPGACVRLGRAGSPSSLLLSPLRLVSLAGPSWAQYDTRRAFESSPLNKQLPSRFSRPQPAHYSPNWDTAMAGTGFQRGRTEAYLTRGPDGRCYPSLRRSSGPRSLGPRH